MNYKNIVKKIIIRCAEVIMAFIFVLMIIWARYGSLEEYPILEQNGKIRIAAVTVIVLVLMLEIGIVNIVYEVTVDKRKEYCFFIVCSLVFGEIYVIYEAVRSYLGFMKIYEDTIGSTIMGKCIFFVPYIILFAVILAIIIMFIKKFAKTVSDENGC